MVRWTYRCSLVVTVLLTVAALCAVTAGVGPSPVAAAGTVSVVGHVGGMVNAVYAAEDYVLWSRGAELEVYTADASGRLGALLLPELIVDIDVDGSTAFVAARDGLYLVSLANLSQPSLMRHIPAPPLEGQVRVSSVVGLGDFAYVGLQDGGLWTVDLNAAAAGVATAQSVTAPTHHFVSELYHYSGYLFSVDNASANPGQPQVWDLSTPGAPAYRGNVNTRADASGLAVAGGQMFISTFFQGLAIYHWDPAQPLAATEAGTLAVGAGAYDLAVTPDGERAILAASTGLVYVDVSNPALPVALDTEPLLLSLFSRVKTHGSRVFAAAGEAALQVYSFDPGSLSYARGQGLRGSPMAGAQLGSDLFVAGNSQGLLKLGVDNPAHPSASGRLETGFSARAVAAVGDYLVVGDRSDVVVVQAGSLTELGRVALPDFNLTWGLAAAGEVVFVAAGHAGLCAVTVTGGEPKLQSCFDTPGEALDVSLDGTRAYVADGDGVEVLNVANPQGMNSLGRYTGAQAIEVAVAGDQLYVSDVNDGDGRLLLLDRGAGAALNFAAQFDTRGFVDDIEVEGNLVYLANAEGLEVLQRASAASLGPWAWYPTPGGAADVVLNGSYIYLMDGANGLLVLTLSVLGAPTEPPPTEPPPTVTPDPDVEAFEVWLPMVAH